MDHAPPRDPKIEYKKYKVMLIVLSLTKYDLSKLMDCAKILDCHGHNNRRHMRFVTSLKT
jgi:hypothetical protein